MQRWPAKGVREDPLADMAPHGLAGAGTGSGGGQSAEQSENLEVELKLTAEAERLEAAWKGRVLAKGGGREVVRRLETTYYDTSDQRLRRRGLALRVRCEGDRYTQTVKTEGEGLSGLQRRGEFSGPIASRTPDLRQITDAELKRRIGLILPGELEPVFTTRIERRIRKLRTDGTRRSGALIEVALDQGEVTSARGAEPIAELELELLEGPALSIYDLAARVNGETPLALETVTKSERGYALALGEEPPWVRADDPAFAPETTLNGAIDAILRSCIRHWLANQAAVLQGSDPEGVHQLRVALRRLRSALSVFKHVLPADDLAWITREARWLIQSLGPARDWDVFLTELLPPLRDARKDNRDLALLSEAAEDARRLGYEQARAALRSSRYTAFALDLGRWTEEAGWRKDEADKRFEEPLADYACRLLRKRQKRVLKQGRDFEKLSDEERHRLRIAVKKLRYASEFFAGLYPTARARPYQKALKSLQDELGHLNDVVVAEALLGSLSGQDGNSNTAALRAAAGLLLGWYSHAVAAGRPEIERRWRGFATTKPFWGRS